MKLPFVSFIIPTYKEEKYLEDCLRSIRNQTYKGKYEIIVVDSKSLDSTVKIAKKFADKVFIIEERGVSKARNFGAKKAKGEILFFVDADTILLPNVLKEVVKAFKKGVVGVNVPISYDDYKMALYGYLATGILLLLLKFNLQPVYSICFACRKDAFEKVGGFNEELKVTEDIELGERLKKIGKITLITSTYAITSTRRVKKWGIPKQLSAWPFGYFLFKFFKRQPAYPPIR